MRHRYVYRRPFDWVPRSRPFIGTLAAAGGPPQTFAPAPVVLTLAIPAVTISRSYPANKDYLPLLRSPHPVK